MNRNQISLAAHEIKTAAKLKAAHAMTNGNTQQETLWASIEGRAHQLSNDACETRWTLKMLRARLANLRKEVVA